MSKRQGKGLTPNPKTPQPAYKACKGITQPAPSIDDKVSKEQRKRANPSR